MGLSSKRKVLVLIKRYLLMEENEEELAIKCRRKYRRICIFRSRKMREDWLVGEG